MGILDWLFRKRETQEKDQTAKRQTTKEKDHTVQQAEELFRIGAEYGQKQQWQQCIEALQEAIRIKPDFAKAHQLIALAYVAIMDKDSAMKHYEILKKLDPVLAKQLEETPSFIMMTRMGPIIRS